MATKTRTQTKATTPTVVDTWGRNGHTHEGDRRVHTAVRIPPEMADQIDKLATHFQVPRSDIIRGALSLALRLDTGGIIRPVE